MKTSTKEFLRKCQLPLLLIFATAPIPLLLFAGLAPERLHFCWICPVLYGMFTILAFLIPGKFRLRYGIAAAVVQLLLGIGILKAAPNGLLAIVPILYCILFLWSLPMAGWSSDRELPSFWYWGGILIHLVAQVVKFLIRTFLSAILEPASVWLLICFFAFAVLAMVSMTRDNMSSAANGRQSPASMQRKNMVLTLICFCVALLVALMPSIIQAVKDFFVWLAELLYDAIFASLSAPEDAVVSQPFSGDDGMPAAASGGSNVLTDILNALFVIIGSILTVIVLIMVLKAAVKAACRLWRRLMSGLSDYAANTAEDYIDEVTDTRSAAPRQKKPRLSAANEQAMTPAQQIRYRYLRLLYKHQNWGRSSTARENLPGNAAALYEQARYSDHPISPEAAARFASETKRV